MLQLIVAILLCLCDVGSSSSRGSRKILSVSIEKERLIEGGGGAVATKFGTFLSILTKFFIPSSGEKM